jgi:hypothetical protein
MRPTTPTKRSASRLLVTIGLVLAACATSEPQADTKEIRQRFDALHVAHIVLRGRRGTAASHAPDDQRPRGDPRGHGEVKGTNGRHLRRHR